MAVIAVAVTSDAPTPLSWELPAGPQALRSPIPRGTVNFHGTIPIALKGANDESSFRLNLKMPTGFVYLPKDIMVRFVSDDEVNEWELLGNGTYSRASFGDSGTGGNGNTPFNLVSPGASFTLAAIKTTIWTAERGTPKLILAGDDQVVMFFADMDAGATTAGDMSWSCQFYVYDVDQIDKWEINTPIPVSSHGIF